MKPTGLSRLRDMLSNYDQGFLTLPGLTAGIVNLVADLQEENAKLQALSEGLQDALVEHTTLTREAVDRAVMSAYNGVL